MTKKRMTTKIRFSIHGEAHGVVSPITLEMHFSKREERDLFLRRMKQSTKTIFEHEGVKLITNISTPKVAQNVDTSRLYHSAESAMYALSLFINAMTKL